MENLYLIIAAVIPTSFFIGYVVYVGFFKRISTPKVTKTRKTVKLIGISVMSNDELIEKDNDELFRKLKELRIKHNLLESRKSYVVRFFQKSGEDKYEYFVGIKQKSTLVPPGFKSVQLTPQHYVTSKLLFTKGKPWFNATMKVKDAIYHFWLPESDYEFNMTQPIKVVEEHIVSPNSNRRATQIFVAIKKEDL